MSLKTTIIAIITSLVFASNAMAADLVINFDDPNPAPKKGFESSS